MSARICGFCSRHMYMYLCTYRDGDQRLLPANLPREPSTLGFETRSLSVAWNLVSRFAWVATEPQGSILLSTSLLPGLHTHRAHIHTQCTHTRAHTHGAHTEHTQAHTHRAHTHCTHTQHTHPAGCFRGKHCSHNAIPSKGPVLTSNL